MEDIIGCDIRDLLYARLVNYHSGRALFSDGLNCILYTLLHDVNQKSELINDSI
jgi:hypothetical protein